MEDRQEKERSGLNSLKKIPLGIRIANWGEHALVFFCGNASKAHWGSGPNNREGRKR